MVYGSEEGLDMRFSRDGMYGRGIYFANSSAYCNHYAYPVPIKKSDDSPKELFQMFLCFVAVGNSCRLRKEDQTLTMPPLISPNDPISRYDCVHNRHNDHTIIYSNSR